MMAEQELPESTVDWIPAIEKTLQKSLGDHKVPDDCGNLVGALFAHQNGLILHQRAIIDKLLKKEAERNLDLQQLQ